jgi:D-alanine-D-alanine ligase
MLVGLTYDLRADYLAMGYSAEETAEFDREDTIDGIEQALWHHGYATNRIGHAKELARRLVAGERWDIVFNICEGFHGVGREAQVPAMLDLYQIPYVFSDPLVLSLCLHKGLTKRVVRDAGIPTCQFHVVAGTEDMAAIDFEPPYFVKPVAEGTGKGCSTKSIVKSRSELESVCLDLVKRFNQPALVEAYLDGREFTVGIIGNGAQAEIVAIMEVLLLQNAEHGLYSFENKSNYEDRVEYRLCHQHSDKTAVAAGQVALDAWKVLGCNDGGRVDIRCNGKQEPQFMEVNPLAGLNPTHSDLPILARMVGIDFNTLIGRIMDAAIARIKGNK